MMNLICEIADWNDWIRYREKINETTSDMWTNCKLLQQKKQINKHLPKITITNKNYNGMGEGGTKHSKM